MRFFYVLNQYPRLIMYIHLHGHSHYSLLEAIGTPADIAAKAHELGMPAIALTDYNGMYGVIEFFSACKKKEVKPIIGVELGLVHDHTSRDRGELAGNIVLLALDITGYQNLLSLVSHANLEWYHYGKARIDFDLLQKFGAGLVCILWWDNSYLGQMLIRGEDAKKIEETISLLRSILGKENVYLELIAQYENKLKDLKKVNPLIQELATSTNTPLLVNTNYHYIMPEDKEVFEVALAIKDGKQVYDADRRKVVGDFYITSEEELINMMVEKNGYDAPLVEKMLAANVALADRCNLEIPLGNILFPNYSPDPEISRLYEENKEKLITQ